MDPAASDVATVTGLVELPFASVTTVPSVTGVLGMMIVALEYGKRPNADHRDLLAGNDHGQDAV